MKLSLIKSVLIGFLISFIAFIAPIYGFKVKAEYVSGRGTFNYADLELSESLLTDLNNIAEFCESKKDEYEFLVYIDKDSSNNFFVKVWYTEIGGNPYYNMQPGNSNFSFVIRYNSYSNKKIYRFNSSSSITDNFYNNFVTYFNENHGGIGTGTSSGQSVFSSSGFPYVFYYSTLENKYNSPVYDLVLDGINYGKTSSNQFYTYYEYLQKNEPIKFIVEDISNNEKRIYADVTNTGFVDSYKYEYTIDNYFDSWIDFTDYAFEFKKSPSHIFKYNGTYRVRIRNSVTGDVIHESSYTIDDLEYSKFTISVKKNYMTYDGQSGSFADFLYSEKNEYYKYQYSFDGEEWFNIPLEDINKDRHYYLYVPFDCTVYGRVLDPLDNVLDFTSITFLSQEIPDIPSNVNRYEIAISDLYDSENQKLNYKVIFYNSSTIVNEDHKISFWINLGGASKRIPLSILHFNNISNKEQFLKNGIPTKYEKTNIPYYFSVPSLIAPSNYVYYGAFQIIPYLNSADFDFSPYLGSKLIIETDLDLDIPVFNSTHAVNSNYTFFNFFQNAFNYFKSSIIAIFGDVGYLFNRLPLALRYFFIVIFGFGLFYILIRFIL